MTKDSQDAAMARALHQYRNWEAQGREGSNQEEAGQLKPDSTPDPRKQQESIKAIAENKTLEEGKWVSGNPAPASDQVQAAGQQLQQSGVFTQSEPLSPNRASHVQNMLDNASGQSGNEPGQGKGLISAVRENAKSAEDAKSPDTAMEMDR